MAKVNKPTGSNPNTDSVDNVPQTEYNSMMWLWVALQFISGGLLTVTVIKVKPNRKGEKDMNKVKKRILTVLLALSAVILVALLVFFGVYFTRIQTIGSIEQLTDY